MQHSLIFVSLIIAMLACRHGQAPVRGHELAAIEARGRIEKKGFVSREMGGKYWPYNIYLPPGYDQSEHRYPVIYVLHGGGGNEDGMRFVAEEYAEKFIATGVMPPALLVFPSGGPDSFFLDNGVIRQQAYNPDAYLVRELIPHIDDNYRSIKESRARAITGFSMGGYGTYHFAFKYPEFFGAAAPMAAGGPYGPGGLITNYSANDKPHSLAVSKSQALREQAIIIAVGGRDLVDYNNELVGILRAQNIPHVYEVLPGVGHDLGAILRPLGEKIFRHLSSRFPRPEAAAPAPGSDAKAPASPAPPVTPPPAPEVAVPRPLPPPPATPDPPSPVEPWPATPGGVVPMDIFYASGITSEWRGGACFEVRVANNTSTPQPWTYRQNVMGRIASVWNAIYSDEQGVWHFTGVASNATLLGGGATTFGYCVER